MRNGALATDKSQDVASQLVKVRNPAHPDAAALAATEVKRSKLFKKSKSFAKPANPANPRVVTKPLPAPAIVSSSLDNSKYALEDVISPPPVNSLDSLAGKTAMIIFTFNRAEYLKRCLSSVFTNYKPGVDIFVSQVLIRGAMRWSKILGCE